MHRLVEDFLNQEDEQLEHVSYSSEYLLEGYIMVPRDIILKTTNDMELGSIVRKML
jgi:hypothetical protein